MAPDRVRCCWDLFFHKTITSHISHLREKGKPIDATVPSDGVGYGFVPRKVILFWWDPMFDIMHSAHLLKVPAIWELTTSMKKQNTPSKYPINLTPTTHLPSKNPTCQVRIPKILIKSNACAIHELSSIISRYHTKRDASGPIKRWWKYLVSEDNKMKTIEEKIGKIETSMIKFLSVF